MFYALSTNQDYLKDRVNLFVSFAPVLRIGSNTSEVLKKLNEARGLLDAVVKELGMFEFFGSNWATEKEKMCKPVPAVCEYFDALMSKSDYNDDTRTLVSSSRFPQAASWRSLAHYAQEIGSEKFERYDFGLTANLRIYGQKYPPEIDVSVIDKVPVAMFVGKQDVLADMEDAKWAAKNIPSTVHFQEIDNCDHGTFMTGIDMSFMNDVAELLSKYNI